MTPAAKKVLNHLRRHPTITRLEALALYHIADLPGRIMEVRRSLDSNVESVVRVFKKDTSGARYAQYSIQPVIGFVRSPLPRSRSLVLYTGA